MKDKLKKIIEAFTIVTDMFEKGEIEEFGTGLAVPGPEARESCRPCMFGAVLQEAELVPEWRVFDNYAALLLALNIDYAELPEKVQDALTDVSDVNDNTGYWGDTDERQTLVQAARDAISKLQAWHDSL